MQRLGKQASLTSWYELLMSSWNASGLQCCKPAGSEGTTFFLSYHLRTQPDKRLRARHVRLYSLVSLFELQTVSILARAAAGRTVYPWSFLRLSCSAADASLSGSEGRSCSFYFYASADYRICCTDRTRSFCID